MNGRMTSHLARPLDNRSFHGVSPSLRSARRLGLLRSRWDRGAPADRSETLPEGRADAPASIWGPGRPPRQDCLQRVELGVVIGRTCRYLESDEEALAAIAGYVVCHDVSEREFQLERGGQWVKGKSCETFNPAGPWLVTADEVADPGDLELWLDVNGQRRQTGTTKKMIFGVAEIVRYLSQFMVLDPGDIINTGTPPGVAMSMPGQPYLRAGDVVELGITGLGRQRQLFVPAP